MRSDVCNIIRRIQRIQIRVIITKMAITMVNKPRDKIILRSIQRRSQIKQDRQLIKPQKILAHKLTTKMEITPLIIQKIPHKMLVRHRISLPKRLTSRKKPSQANKLKQIIPLRITAMQSTRSLR
jgi:hypothetical protein